MMATFLGEHSRATQAYHREVVNKLTYIAQQINMTYVEPMIQKEIFCEEDHGFHCSRNGPVSYAIIAPAARRTTSHPAT